MCACMCVSVFREGGIHAGNHGDGEVLRLIRGTHTEGTGKCGLGVCAIVCPWRRSNGPNNVLKCC